MRIAIEAQRIFRPDKHGMDFVVLEQLREIQRTDTENEYYVIVAPGDDPCLQETERMHIIELKCPTYPLWEQVALPSIIRKLKPDLLHCTSNTAPIFCPVPLLLTLHDIIYMERRHSGSKSWYQRLGWHYRRLVVPRIVSHCRHIITVSETERSRIQAYFQLRDEDISVLHNGYSTQYCPSNADLSIVKQYVPEGKYIFFMGNTEPRKNTRRVLKAYKIYRQQSSSPLPLLISGLKEEELSQMLEEEKLQDLKPYLYYPGYLPGKDMPVLFCGAFVFLFPSLSEGFGIPIIESMACGTPVITSDISAMPEVAGEGAILIDPMNEKAIVDKILELESSSEFYNQQKIYGLKRAQKFSWKQNTKKLISIYKNYDTKYE